MVCLRGGRTRCGCNRCFFLDAAQIIDAKLRLRRSVVIQIALQHARTAPTGFGVTERLLFWVAIVYTTCTANLSLSRSSLAKSVTCALYLSVNARRRVLRHRYRGLPGSGLAVVISSVEHHEPVPSKDLAVLGAD